MQKPLKPHHFPLVLAITLVVFLTIGIIYWWQTGERADSQIIEKDREEKLILVRSGALLIEEFFQSQKTELLILAEMEAVKALRETDGRKAFGLLINHFQEKKVPFVGIGRLDKEGRVVWEENAQGTREGEGVLLADRDYFLWAKEQKKPGKIYISQPVVGRGGVAVGEQGLVMAAPVFYQNQFNGLVFVPFPLKSLTEKLIFPLARSSDFQSLIIDQEGVVITGTIPEVIGQKLKDCPTEKETQLLSSILTGKGGGLVHRFCLPPYPEGIEMVVAYDQIVIGEEKWRLLVLSPYDYVLEDIASIRETHFRGLVVILEGIVLVILIFIVGLRVTEKKSFTNGFRDGRDGIRKVKKRS